MANEKLLRVMFNLGDNEKPWSESDIDEFLDSVEQSMQRATDEIRGASVEEMKPEDILNDGRIIDTTDDGELVVMYRGEKFTVTIDHPEL